MKRAIITLLLVIWTVPGMKIFAQQDVKINGRIQYDYEFLKRDREDKWKIGNEFRRVHLSASGKLSEVFKYKIEVNFSHASLGFRDVYIEYLGGKYGNFAVGSKAEPTGLDIATSSKYIPFAERAMLTALQDFRWGTGIHYANHRLFDGRAGVQAAVTNKGSNGEGFVDKELEKGVNLVGRIYGKLEDKNHSSRFIHLGANYASRPYKDLKFRAENHMGPKYHYTMPGGVRRLESGFEFAGVYDRFSVQSEYKISEIPNTVAKDYRISGYYVLGSFFLTGEHRPYKHGAFGRVKPRKDIREGWGAWEVLVRYSEMAFSDDIVAVPDNAGMPDRIRNLGWGVNWYLTSHVRIMYNYIITRDQHPSGNLRAHIIRFQLDF
ncbi:MAG: hypothetical protein GXO27_01670 [Chlorobi bacterium]|nr:hypothetical protein [Chlorobiota bacterium]